MALYIFEIKYYLIEYCIIFCSFKNIIYIYICNNIHHKVCGHITLYTNISHNLRYVYHIKF